MIYFLPRRFAGYMLEVKLNVYASAVDIVNMCERLLGKDLLVRRGCGRKSTGVYHNNYGESKPRLPGGNGRKIRTSKEACL